MLKIIITVLIIAVVLFGILPVFPLSYAIYSVVLVRNKPDKWARGISFPDDEVCVQIYKDGEKWAEPYRDRITEVSVVSDGFRLVGEYFDFGADRAVIIIPGRTEACEYSYHFAKPYQEAGFNVLVIDNRCHGLSQGKYPALGFKEYRDIIEWSRLLHDEYGNKKVVLHGICIGSSTALFALTSKDCPDYLCAMTADGMYARFYESFRNHMVEQKRPLFPFLYLVMLYIRIFSGAKPMTDGPIKRISAMTKPILFIHSKEDQYSLPSRAEELFALCGSDKKQIKWFDHGEHSRIRIIDSEKYDKIIVDFYTGLGL